MQCQEPGCECGTMLGQVCGWCSGSGEGMADGASCTVCRGKGEAGGGDQCERCEGSGLEPCRECGEGIPDNQVAIQDAAIPGDYYHEECA